MFCFFFARRTDHKSADSLIIGVKKWKYDVEISDKMVCTPYYPLYQLIVINHQVQFKPDSFLQTTEEILALEHRGPPSTFISKTVTGPAVYHFGIIDFLQNWTISKRIERGVKIYILRKDPDGLSVMEPLQYKLRFQRKLDQIFDMDPVSGGIGKADLINAIPADPEPLTDSTLDSDIFSGSSNSNGENPLSNLDQQL